MALKVYRENASDRINDGRTEETPKEKGRGAGVRKRRGRGGQKTD